MEKHFLHILTNNFSAFVTHFPSRDRNFTLRFSNESDFVEAARFALRTRFDTSSILGIETVGRQRPIQVTGFENTAKQCGQRKFRIGKSMRITLQPRNFNCSSRSEQKEHL
jgi:hypothetical protein